MATIRQTLLRHAPKILGSVALLYVLAAVAYWITLYLQHRIAGDEFFVERLEFWGQGVLLILFYAGYVLVRLCGQFGPSSVVVCRKSPLSRHYRGAFLVFHGCTFLSVFE